MDEHELRERFRELRREDESRAPSFAATLAAARRRRSRRARLRWGAAALAATGLLSFAVGLQLGVFGASGAGSIDTTPRLAGDGSLDGWTAPSDLLLAAVEPEVSAPGAPDIEPDDSILSFRSPTAGFLDLEPLPVRRTP